MSDPRHYHVKDGIGPVSIDPGKSSSIKLRKVTHVVLEPTIVCNILRIRSDQLTLSQIF